MRGPQPEMVAGYRLLAGEKEILRVEGNIHRKRVHRLEATLVTDFLRLEVTGTHGILNARVHAMSIF